MFVRPSRHRFVLHRLLHFLGIVQIMHGVLDTKTSNSEHPQSLIRETTSSWLHWILPGFLNGDAYRAPRKTNATSYLVALRGIAACIVLNSHMGIRMHSPLLKILNGAGAMVYVFFVISGYSLSYKPVQLMHQRKEADLFRSLAGSMFRRWFHLYIPCILAIAVTVISKCRSWSSIGSLFWGFIKDVQQFINPFHAVPGFWVKESFGSKYLEQLWTIPIEFQASMVLFCVCTGVGMLSNRARTNALLGLVALTIYFRVVYIGLFLAGTLLAERNLLRQAKGSFSLPRHNTSLPVVESIPEWLSFGETNKEKASLEHLLPGNDVVVTMPSKVKRARLSIRIPSFAKVVRFAAVLLILVMSLTALSGPRTVGKSSPALWRAIRYLIPPWWPHEDKVEGNEQLSFGLAAIGLIYCFEEWPVLQKPLLWNFMQYVGDLSFGIYTLHYITLGSIDSKLLHPWQKSVGGGSWALLLRVFGVYFAVFWVADYFYRADKIIVNWGYRLQKYLFLKTV